MKALNINDLHKYCEKEMLKGHGDYVVFVTDDEEGNGYHALWFIGETAEDMTKENRKYCEEINHDVSILKNKKKAIYIG